MNDKIKLVKNWQMAKIPTEDSAKIFEGLRSAWDKIGNIKDAALLIRDDKEQRYIFYENFDVHNKIFLSHDNKISLPMPLLDMLGWKNGDELYADIFNEDLEQIVIGRKLSGEDAIKGLDKITSILE